ncbi:MAG: hypothetical protein ACRD36_04380 [Candidatus Acidiferrum sp.]
MDCLGVGSHAKSGDEDCELGVYYFFAVALFGHRSNLAESSIQAQKKQT